MSARQLMVLMAVLTGASAQAQDISTIDDGDLQKLVDRLVPVIEKVCGRKFQRPPTVVLADVGDIMRVLRVELEPQTAAFFAGMPRGRIRRALQLRADMTSAGVMGKYVFDGGEVLVVPNRVATHLAILGIDADNAGAVLQVVVLHELVHALQDQELRVGAHLARAVTMPAADALVMLIEGHAVLCSELAAAELDLQRGIEPMRAVIAGTKKPLAELGSLLEGRRVRGRSSLLYLASAELLGWEYEHGGAERLWQLLAEGRTVAAMLRPQSAANAPDVRDASACFDGVDELLAGRTWTVGRGPLSEATVLCENFAERQATLSALAEWRAGGEWLATSPTPLAWRAVHAMMFTDAEAASRFVDLAQRCALQDLVRALGKPVTGSPGPAWSDGVSRRVVQEKGGSLARADAQLVWFLRGAKVVQVTLVNAPLDDEALLAAAERVLRQLR